MGTRGAVTGFFFSSSQSIVWIAALERAVGPEDEVVVVVTRDTMVRERTPQAPGTYQCLGAESPRAYEPGVWVIEVLVNGDVAASGSAFVQ